MSDLIERDRAIAVIDRCKHRLQGQGSTYEIMPDIIKTIPSAEPTWTSVLAELHERFDALEKELRKASAEMSAIIREYVDRPKGEWIDMGDFEQCSVCKGTHLKEFQTYYGKATWIKTDFCPSCGADMRGERSGTDKDKFEQ